jgi:quinol monooxygenase YgiN
MLMQTYLLQAQQERVDALLLALRTLRNAIIDAGCQSAEIWRDQNESLTYVFTERWPSLEAYQQASERLPKQLFAPVMAAIAGRPQMRTLHAVEE